MITQGKSFSTKELENYIEELCKFNYDNDGIFLLLELEEILECVKLLSFSEEVREKICSYTNGMFCIKYIYCYFLMNLFLCRKCLY